MQQLDSDEMVSIIDSRTPERSEYRKGPLLAKLESPWEEMGRKIRCTILDQDDYLIVRGIDGVRNIKKGPLVYMQHWGEEIVLQSQSIQVPVNHYIIIEDSDSTEKPIVHIRGPLKWYPEPFQIVKKNPQNGKEYSPCIEVRADRAVHMLTSSGESILLDRPGYIMPMVGEKVLGYVNRQVLLSNDFCILKAPNGDIDIKNGENPTDRSFFLRPYEEFLQFNCDGMKTVLSTLPTFMPHKFLVRTQDNVVIELDMRISYKIDDVLQFAHNAIEFYDYIRSHVQNNLLDRFAQVNLREFLANFGKIALTTLSQTQEHFRKFGIDIEDLMILNHKCTNPNTERLLQSANHERVTKEKELRAKMSDVGIQEEANKVKRKQKDLEVQMCMKDNEVSLQEKVMENTLRMQEMDIEIAEEEKRSELLEVRRANDVVEAEFEGRAKGHQIREYLRGIGENLTTTQKIDFYDRKCQLETGKLLYDKADKFTLYPHGVDVKTFQMDNEEDAEIVRKSYLEGIGLTQGQQAPHDEHTHFPKPM
jgi:regulator of protease activity HflC (stomatin/prohibitin superfamily)